jgi:RNA polymerase sigma-70 factor (ECF subfamily)
MRAAVAGDNSAYDRLLRSLALTLRSSVQRGLARSGRGGADVEDIVQEVLLAVHLKRHTWDTSRPIGPWINAISRHKLADVLRRRGGQGEIPIDLLAETLPAPDAPPNALAYECERALDRLPTTQRAVVQAIAIEGATTSEAAEKLTMSEGAVRVALHRALVNMAKPES